MKVFKPIALATAIYGSIYGILIFNEKLELFHYLGASLVFFGVFLARKKSIN